MGKTLAIDGNTSVEYCRFELETMFEAGGRDVATCAVEISHTTGKFAGAHFSMIPSGMAGIEGVPADFLHDMFERAVDSACVATGVDLLLAQDFATFHDEFQEYYSENGRSVDMRNVASAFYNALSSEMEKIEGWQVYMRGEDIVV